MRYYASTCLPPVNIRKQRDAGGTFPLAFGSPVAAKNQQSRQNGAVTNA
jgi:hypothetical protein